MSRSSQRFTIALAVLTLATGLVAALVYIALLGKSVGADNILYIVVGTVSTWGGSVLSYYFGTSESSVHKTDVMATALDAPRDVHVTNKPNEPVPTTEGDKP